MQRFPVDAFRSVVTPALVLLLFSFLTARPLSDRLGRVGSSLAIVYSLGASRISCPYLSIFIFSYLFLNDADCSHFASFLIVNLLFFPLLMIPDFWGLAFSP